MIEARAFYETAERLFLIADSPSISSNRIFLETIPYEVLLRMIMGRAYIALFLDARLKAWVAGWLVSTLKPSVSMEGRTRRFVNIIEKEKAMRKESKLQAAPTCRKTGTRRITRFARIYPQGRRGNR